MHTVLAVAVVVVVGGRGGEGGTRKADNVNIRLRTPPAASGRRRNNPLHVLRAAQYILS